MHRNVDHEKADLYSLDPALVASGIWAFVLQPDGEEGAEFKFAEIARGDIENVVSGTGTLNPVGTVEVGTQVSGTIDHLYADFNDHVTVGQLLAVLDTSALAASVREGEASVARTRAQHNLAVDEYDRHLILARKGLPLRTGDALSGHSSRNRKSVAPVG